MNKDWIKAEITYHNGITQIKNIIPHFIHENIITPLKRTIYFLEDIDTKQSIKTSKEIKKVLDQTYGDYLTTQSPLFNAISRQNLCLPEHQGGCRPVTINIINK